MTIDDKQQELVVKVNNTLKRVNPVTSPKEPLLYQSPGYQSPLVPAHQSPVAPPTHSSSSNGEGSPEPIFILQRELNGSYRGPTDEAGGGGTRGVDGGEGEERGCGM